MRAILQSEAAECGLACLAMVGDAHGLRMDLSEMRRRFSVSLKGATLATLIRHAQALNLSARPLRLDLRELPQLRLPCVLHWNLSHFVVLKSVKGQWVTVLDPAVGERRLPMSEVSSAFTGVALELTPTAAFKPADERKRIQLRELIGPISGLRRVLTQIFLLALALEVFALASPLFNQFVVDEVVLSGDRELLGVMGRERAMAAYFSDRGRPFQADRGRRIGVAGGALGKHARTGLNVAQSSTISLKCPSRRLSSRSVLTPN
jgi:ATP-binding cassette subfamily B protein RaxB